MQYVPALSVKFYASEQLVVGAAHNRQKTNFQQEK